MIAIETTSPRIRSLLFFIRALFVEVCHPNQKHISVMLLPKFIELCVETPYLCPSEGQKHGGRGVTKTAVVEFCY